MQIYHLRRKFIELKFCIWKTYRQLVKPEPKLKVSFELKEQADLKLEPILPPAESEPTIEDLVFDDGAGTVLVQKIQENQYKILGPEIAIMTEQYECGDIVEVTQNENNQLVIVRCLEYGNYKTDCLVLPSGWNENEEIIEILDKICLLEGRWEGVFGGLLIFVLPRGCQYDPSEDIYKALDRNIQE